MERVACSYIGWWARPAVDSTDIGSQRTAGDEHSGDAVSQGRERTVGVRVTRWADKAYVWLENAHVVKRGVRNARVQRVAMYYYCAIESTSVRAWAWVLGGMRRGSNEGVRDKHEHMGGERFQGLRVRTTLALCPRHVSSASTESFASACIGPYIRLPERCCADVIGRRTPTALPATRRQVATDAQLFDVPRELSAKRQYGSVGMAVLSANAGE